MGWTSDTQTQSLGGVRYKESYAANNNSFCSWMQNKRHRCQWKSLIVRTQPLSLPLSQDITIHTTIVTRNQRKWFNKGKHPCHKNTNNRGQTLQTEKRSLGKAGMT